MLETRTFCLFFGLGLLDGCTWENVWGAYKISEARDQTLYVGDGGV